MTIYKFRDTIDGNYCFVVAKDKDEALDAVQRLTSIPVVLVDQKPVEQLNKPVVLFNTVLPF